MSGGVFCFVSFCCPTVSVVVNWRITLPRGPSFRFPKLRVSN